MTRHTLPILVPGRSTPIHVPCTLPESFSVSAFLPSRGLREFTCWLTTRDPLTAEVKDVVLNNREGDPRGPNGYELDEDEQRRADEAASDVLGEVLNLLGLHGAARTPGAWAGPQGSDAAPLHAIAFAFHAEQYAVEMGSRLHALYLKREVAYSEDINKRIPDLTSERGQDDSAACEAMRCYVSEAQDAACAAQSDKAEAQRDAWVPPSHPEDRNPPAWSERCEGC